MRRVGLRDDRRIKAATSGSAGPDSLPRLTELTSEYGGLESSNCAGRIDGVVREERDRGAEVWGVVYCLYVLNGFNGGGDGGAADMCMVW